jgi:2-oxoisovalerate dehydrogenase E1 component
VEAETYRFHGHYEGDPQRYRPPEEVAEERARDALGRARQQLVATGKDQSLVDRIDEEVDEEIEAGVAAARAAPVPDVADLGRFTYAARSTQAEARVAPAADLGTFRMMDALNEALAQELDGDPSVFALGIDIGRAGGIFGVTRGLHDRWPERVRDTPIAETAVLGIAVGSAMAGMRPVAELMFVDFLGVCFDQLLNQAAKLPFMTGGRARMALTVRTQFGAGRSSGSQHSQSLEALLAHIPGLTVVMPSTPADAYGLLRAAIRDPNPVIFVEHRHLYGLSGPRPYTEHLLPLGRGVVVRPGRHVTVVTYSRMVHEALAAAEVLAGEGIDVEVLDLRTVAPLDRDLILESLGRTSRLVVAHEATQDFGVGAEIAALAAGPGFWSLDAPVLRVGAPCSPAPYAPNLERAWLIDAERIAATCREAVSW